MKKWLLTATLLGLGACAAPDEPVVDQEVEQDAGPLHIVSGRGELRLTNTSDRPISVQAYDWEVLRMWDPPAECDQPTICPFLSPGEQMVVPHTEIVAYRKGGEYAAVVWWGQPPPPFGVARVPLFIPR